MRSKLAVLALVLLAAATPAISQQAGTDTKDAPKLTPEQAAMMAAWEKAGAPGPEHQRLARMAGEWSFVSRMWQAPGTPPEESRGTSSSEMIYGGRYLLDKTRGEAMGQPFEGMGLLGYDNVKKRYFGTWIDSMSTGMMVSEGHWDAATSSLVMEGDYADPMTGSSKHVRTVTRVVSDRQHVFEYFEPGPDGTLVKTMEIAYTRK